MGLALLALPLSASAQFPGTNGKLVYLNQAGDLMSANPDGTGVVTIVTASTLNATTPPVVNKLGTKMAYANATGLALINVDGTGFTQLTSTAGDEFPQFSPDGAKLYFDNGGDILSIGTDGTSRTTVLAQAGNLTYVGPTVSPDGLTLGVIGSDSGTNISDVYTVAATGGSATNVTNNASGTNTFAADYSPDGTQFLLLTEDATDGRIATMAVAGGAQTTLATLALSSNTVYTSATWSPDGAKVVAVRSSTSGGSGLFSQGTILTMLADGTGAADISSLGANNSPVFWSVLGLTVAAPALPNTATPFVQLPWLWVGLGLLAIAGIELGRRLRRI